MSVSQYTTTIQNFTTPRTFSFPYDILIPLCIGIIASVIAGCLSGRFVWKNAKVKMREQELFSIADNLEMIAKNFKQPASSESDKRYTEAIIDAGTSIAFLAEIQLNIQSLFLRGRELLGERLYVSLGNHLAKIETARQVIEKWFNCHSQLEKDSLGTQVDPAMSEIHKNLNESARYIREQAAKAS